MLPYDSRENSHGHLASAVALPHDPEGLQQYAKDLRFNGKTEKIIFHVRFLTSIPVAHLKRAHYPEIGQAGRITMKLLKRHDMWFKAQQCAETRVARLGWFVRSHTNDGINNFRAQLCAFWKERNLILPEDQWQISARRFIITCPGKKKIETTALWVDSGIP